MACYWIYNPDTGLVYQKMEGVGEPAAQAAAEVFGGLYRECGEESPDSGIRINDENWEYLPPAIPAESPEVTSMKAERISMLNQSAWTQTADAPLTEACREAYRAWRVCLHRWLLDYPDGSTPLPPEPDLEYLPLTDQV